LVDQMAEHLDEALAAEGAEISWSEDIAPWFDGRLAVAMLEVPISSDPTSMEAVPPALVMAGVSDSAAAAAAIESLLQEAGAPTFTETEHAGVTIQSTDEATGGA